MAEYHLPAGPAELLETARQTIGKYLGGEHHLRLGGGTALAARWGHRHSTDVDLFVTPRAFKGLFEHRDAFRRELYAMVAEPASIHVNEGFAKIVVGKTGDEISIDTSEPRGGR
ncbi:MAG: nucleotidyl transferase AbiEii/AbiGii toxin family protein [Gammaproteobacteria bacterium]|nr:nucleotidyl transferase AbiEii/AbiGii toxin family protein [Gammaproteobacteria bacterium]